MSIDVGGDIGFGSIKLYGKANGVLVSSLVGKLTHKYVSDSNRNLGHTHYVTFDDMNYVVGVAAWTIGKASHNQSMDRLINGSYDARAAIYAALGQYFGGKAIREPLNMYIGLPASLLDADHKAATIASVTGWLAGNHEWIFNDRPMRATIEAVSFRTQATGALGDMIHNLQGQQTKDIEFMDTGVGVVSIGMNTVELSGAKRGRPVDTMIASLENSGVRAMIDEISSMTHQSTGEIDEDLRSGRQVIPVNILSDWSDKIIAEVSQKWQTSLPTLGRILLVGGGAQYIADAMRQRIGNIVHVPAEPMMSVARGLYKWSVANGNKG